MTVKVCPECDSTQIRTVVNHPSSPTDRSDEWCCRTCQSGFDQPEKRESRTDSSVRSELARKLEQADPDDLGEFTGDADD